MISFGRNCHFKLKQCHKLKQALEPFEEALVDSLSFEVHFEVTEAFCDDFRKVELGYIEIHVNWLLSTVGSLWLQKNVRTILHPLHYCFFFPPHKGNPGEVEMNKPSQDFCFICGYFNTWKGLIHWASTSVLVRCRLDACIKKLKIAHSNCHMV